MPLSNRPRSPPAKWCSKRACRHPSKEERMNIPENAALSGPHIVTARTTGSEEPQVIRLLSDTAPLATVLDGRSLLVLHLLPGVLIGAAFVLLARALEPSGAPANLALLLAMLVVALPVELGYVLWLTEGGHGASTLMMPIPGGHALPRRQAVRLIALLFIWSLLGIRCWRRSQHGCTRHCSACGQPGCSWTAWSSTSVHSTPPSSGPWSA